MDRYMRMRSLSQRESNSGRFIRPAHSHSLSNYTWGKKLGKEAGEEIIPAHLENVTLDVVKTVLVRSWCGLGADTEEVPQLAVRNASVECWVSRYG